MYQANKSLIDVRQQDWNVCLSHRLHNCWQILQNSPEIVHKIDNEIDKKIVPKIVPETLMKLPLYFSLFPLKIVS